MMVKLSLGARKDIMEQPLIRAFFNKATDTVSYLVWDFATKDGAAIDPVLNWDNRFGEADTTSADALINAAAEAGITIRWVLVPIREVSIHVECLGAILRSMMRIMAIHTKASAMRQWRSKSRARRRWWLIQPSVRSTIHRFGSTTKRCLSQRRTISTVQQPVRATAAAILGP